MIAYLTPSTFWYGHPPTLDLSEADTSLESHTRRLSRVATLDGGAVFLDGGWSDADRTMTLALRDLSEADAATLRAMAAYTACYLSVAGALYLGRVKSHQLTPTAASITYWVEEKLL